MNVQSISLLCDLYISFLNFRFFVNFGTTFQAFEFYIIKMIFLILFKRYTSNLNLKRLIFVSRQDLLFITYVI